MSTHNHSYNSNGSGGSPRIITITRDTTDPLRVALAVVAWFALALIFNWSSKSSLTIVPSPLTFTMVQIFAVMLYALISSKLQSQPIEPPSYALMKKMIPLGMLQLSTKFLHQLALTFISVALVHTIKVTSPIFVILSSRFITGEVPTLQMLLSIIPIITGVILSMNTEAEWNVWGGAFAILGTVSIALQNSFSKVILSEKHANGLTLVFYTDLAALVVLVPMWLILEGYQMIFQLMHPDVLFYVMMNGFSSFLQTFVSFYVIVNTTVLTYSILTVVKRAVLIVGSIFYYRNPMTVWHFVGLFIAFLGVSWYTKIKIEMKKKAGGGEGGEVDRMELGLKAFH